jgi:hypothetical protein
MILASYFPQIFSRTNAPIETLSERVLNAIRLGKSFDFQSLNAPELKTLLDEISLLLKPEELDRLADMLPLETLEAAVRLQYPEHTTALQTAKSMLQEAKYYLAATECKASTSLKAYLSSILSSLITILESFINAFGIADFFKPPETSFDSDYKGQKIMLVLTLFTVLSGILMPLLGASLGAMIIGGTLLTIAAISLIYPYVKPQSMSLLRGQNWTELFQQGELFAIDGRKETLDEIARILISTKQTGLHAMLLGLTGIGKTETIKAFVKSVARGDYPELQGKQVIYFNTAELLSGTELFSNVNKIFAYITEGMGRHRDDYILIFDGIHNACKKRNDGALSEQLATFLDQGTDKFHYVIGITSEEEYDREIHQKNPAFARRFQRVVIQNTNDSETLKILNNARLKKSPATILEPNTLQTLLNKAKQAFPQAVQPATALKILSECINRTSPTQRLPLEARVETLRARLQALYAQGAGHLPYGRANEAPALEAELRQMEEHLRVAKECIRQIFENRDRLTEIKKSALKKIVNIENSTSPKEKQQLNILSLQMHFQARLLESKVRKDADAFRVKIAIDAPLIDQVIAEEQERKLRVQQAINRGREQLEQRIPGGG